MFGRPTGSTRLSPPVGLSLSLHCTVHCTMAMAMAVAVAVMLSAVVAFSFLTDRSAAVTAVTWTGCQILKYGRNAATHTLTF